MAHVSGRRGLCAAAERPTHKDSLIRTNALRLRHAGRKRQGEKCRGIKEEVLAIVTTIDNDRAADRGSAISSVEGRSSRGHSLERGECGACARACNPLPGGFGHQRSGTTAGVGVETLDWDRRARVTPTTKACDLRPGWRSIGPCAPAASQEAWPGAESGGCDRPTRTAVERREASAPVFGAPRARNGVPAARARRGAPSRTSGNTRPRGAVTLSASLGVPLPLFICCSPG